MVKKARYAVILAGGGGTRLWPKSRKATPKQFLKLLNDKTLFQETIDRASGLFPISNIFIVTSSEFVAEIRKQAQQLNPENIIIEPAGKNTAAAAALAAAYIARQDEDAVVTTFASDHYIEEKNKFLKTLAVAQGAAAKGEYLVTIGIHPTHAHTGMGYIHVGGEAFRIGKIPIFKVKEFKEKPNHAAAHAYYASGEYFWNANTNSYRTATLLNEIKRHLPTLWQVAAKIIAGQGLKEVKKDWELLPSEPIDTGILEKSKNVLMVPGEFSWHDIGDWGTLHQLLSKSSRWNVLVGDAGAEHISIDTEGCLIHGTDRLIATIGVKDLVVIDTPDVLLICPKEKSQEVKRLVGKLIAEKKHRYL